MVNTDTDMTALSDTRWLRGGLYGAVGYLTALLFTELWFYFDHYRTPVRANLESLQQTVGIGSVTFYNGQFVEGPSSFLYAFGSSGHGFILTPVYRIIPIVAILLVAGAFVYTEADAASRFGALLSGASLATGYVVLSVIVALVFNSVAPSSISYFPLPLGAVAVSGFLYAGVLGGVAGVVANEIKGYVGDGASAPGVERNM